MTNEEKARTEQDAMRAWWGQEPVVRTWEEQADAVFARII